MNGIRTLERCGKPVAGKAGRPCMRVSGHLGDCIPALLNSDELNALESRIDANSAYGKEFPFRMAFDALFPKPAHVRPVYFAIVAGLAMLLALQAGIDGYVIALMFRG